MNRHVAKAAVALAGAVALVSSLAGAGARAGSGKAGGARGVAVAGPAALRAIGARLTSVSYLGGQLRRGRGVLHRLWPEAGPRR